MVIPMAYLCLWILKLTFLKNDHKNNFRLSFAAADKKEIIEGLSRMVKIIKNMM